MSRAITDQLGLDHDSRKDANAAAFGTRVPAPVRGWVFDRQGRPVAGAQVFQSGDGPERTKTETDAEGKFALEGSCWAGVCLCAQAGFDLRVV